jgi:hypothetical protein
MGVRRPYTDTHQGFHPFLTGSHCDHQFLMVSISLDLGINPGDEGTSSGFNFLLTGPRIFLKNLKLLVVVLYLGFQPCRQFFLHLL